MATTRPVNMPIDHIPLLDAPLEPRPGAFDHVVVPDGEQMQMSLGIPPGGKKRKTLRRQPGTELGRLIRERRSVMGYTLKQLGDKTNISYRDLCRIELGDGSPPEIARLTRIASALNLVSDWPTRGMVSPNKLLELLENAIDAYRSRKSGAQKMPEPSGGFTSQSVPVDKVPVPEDSTTKPVKLDFDVVLDRPVDGPPNIVERLKCPPGDIAKIADSAERDLDEDRVPAPAPIAQKAASGEPAADAHLDNVISFEVQRHLTINRQALVNICHEKLKRAHINDLLKIIGILPMVVIKNDDEAMIRLQLYCQYCGTVVGPKDINNTGIKTMGYQVTCPNEQCGKSFPIDLDQIVKDILLS